jgi:hypothetical protein
VFNKGANRTQRFLSGFRQREKQMPRLLAAIFGMMLEEEKARGIILSVVALLDKQIDPVNGLPKLEAVIPPPPRTALLLKKCCPLRT